LDYIGKVENYDHDISHVFARIFGDPEAVEGQWMPHATNAQKKLREFYGPVETRLVLAKYAEDFRAFNYPTDPLDTTNAPVLETSHADPLLTALVAAEARRARGDIRGAIDALRPEAEARPDEPDAAHFLGQLYKTSGSNGEAAKWLDQAVDVAVGRPGVFTKAAMLHSQLGNRDAAAKIAAIGLKEFPYNSRLRKQAEQIGDNSVFEPADPGEMESGSNAARPGAQVLGRSARAAFRSVIRKFRN
jgi:tetratricopeptide (TPR) repeat protein